MFFFQKNSFKKKNITAVVGTNTLDKDGDSYASKDIIPHEKYDSFLIHNDIGLIELVDEIQFSEKIQPVKLPLDNFNKSDYPAVLSGWGTTSVSQHSNKLQFSELHQPL